MLDPHSRGVLQQASRRESRSLLQYVREAFPWTRPEEESSALRLKQMAAEHGEAIARLLSYLQRQHATVPYFGPFPISFTSVNFVTLDYLRPLLARHTEQEIAFLKKDLAAVTEPEARNLLSQLIALKELQHSEFANGEKHLQAHPQPSALAPKNH